MALPTTEAFDEMVLEHSSDGGTTYTKLCGMTDVTVTRSSTIDTTELQDCDDESLPLSISKAVRSVEVSVSGTGVWAQESHETLSDWFYLSTLDYVRVGHTKAASGDTEYEYGPAVLASLNNSRTKGKVVEAEIEIQFSGTPTRTVKA